MMHGFRVEVRNIPPKKKGGERCYGEGASAFALSSQLLRTILGKGIYAGARERAFLCSRGFSKMVKESFELREDVDGVKI
jgi:hypothetical protein